MGCTLGVAFSTPGTHPAGARTRYQGRATIGMSVRTTDGLVAGRNRTPTTLRSPRCRCFDDDAKLALVHITGLALDDRLLGCPCGSHGSEGCKGLASIRAVSIELDPRPGRSPAAQEASTAALMRCANASASLAAALRAKPTSNLPTPCPAKELNTVTRVCASPTASRS